MTNRRPYVGRFAPSPTGRLHLGSLVAAVASYLDARAHGGKWLVRIEDLDPPREVEGASSDILKVLEGHGLHWDGEVLFQSSRHEAYEEALNNLVSEGSAFGCICTRRDLSMISDRSSVYPGTCRLGLPPGVSPRSWRFRMPVGQDLVWLDRIKGTQRYSRESVGDVTLKRADGLWAYHLAVVVDDAFQSVTDIVRGEDLLSSTAAHLAIQQALSLPTINYAHHSVVRNNQGQKLSKQTRAVPVEVQHASKNLGEAFKHLGLSNIDSDRPNVMLSQATGQWNFIRGEDL